MLNLERGTNRLALGIDHTEMGWVLTASLISGLTALFLSVILGGWMPVNIARRGGWMVALRANSSAARPDRVLMVQRRIARSGHGRLARAVHLREEGTDLVDAHGGLHLLAMPFQFCLAIVPLIIVAAIPQEWITQGRWLEAVVIVYLLLLGLMLRWFPLVASRLLTPMAIVRRGMVRRTALSWLTPILLLWFLSRLILPLVLTALEPALPIDELIMSEHSLAVIFGYEILAPPEAFLDLVVALSVLPFATYTGLAVLSGGGGTLPAWWLDPNWVGGEKKNENLEGKEIEEEKDVNDEGLKHQDTQDQPPRSIEDILRHLP